MALSHKKLSSWYMQLSQSQDAGLPLAQCLHTSEGPPKDSVKKMAEDIEAGISVNDVLRSAPGWLPKDDRYFISAAASTGRLPQMLKILADRHERIGANKMKAVLAMLYPIGILNFAILLIPVMSMIDFEKGFTMQWALYFSRTGVMLGGLWGTIGLLFYLIKTESPVIPKLMLILPGFRGYYKAQAMSRFSFALGSFLDAGMPMTRSWAGAAMVAADPALQKAADTMKPVLESGLSPGEHLSKHTCFPPEFKALYQSGAQTGQLDANLIKLGNLYQEKANMKMNMTAIMYPTVCFLIIAGFVVYSIFGMYGSYLDGIVKMME